MTKKNVKCDITFKMAALQLHLGHGSKILFFKFWDVSCDKFGKCKRNVSQGLIINNYYY